MDITYKFTVKNVHRRFQEKGLIIACIELQLAFYKFCALKLSRIEY